MNVTEFNEKNMFGVYNVHTSVKLQESRITLPIVDILRTVDAFFVAYYFKQQNVF